MKRVNAKTSAITSRYWAERGGKPKPRPRTPLTDEEEHAYLVAGSKLFNERDFYQGHDEWEEVWRRATGPRRRLLHGLIQVAVGYEHNERGNPRGRRSLLRQGAAKLRSFVRRPGVSELRRRALADAQREGVVTPPKILVGLEGLPARRPARSIEIRVPAARGSRGSGAAPRR